MLVFSSGTTHFQSFTNISNLRMITNMICAVMGILGPGIYLGAIDRDLSLGVSRNVSIFQRPVPKCIMAVFKCSLQTQNVVRDKL
jgi:hypothetical protein